MSGGVVGDGGPERAAEGKTEATTGHVNTDTEGSCPHCSHSWTYHRIWLGENKRCGCGCYWTPPKAPEAPKPPPTDHDLLVAVVKAAIYDELDAQHEVGGIGGAGYWDSDWGCLDGEPDWNRVAEAAIRAIEEATP